jgi:8-oxo-dGTP diphosphatase
VEDDESPAEGAARELAEETGLAVDPRNLRLVSTVTTTHGTDESSSWNYVAEVASPRLRVDDPDGIILEARWFARADAVGRLAELPYQPLSEPAVAYLRGDAPPGQHWTYRR